MTKKRKFVKKKTANKVDNKPKKKKLRETLAVQEEETVDETDNDSSSPESESESETESVSEESDSETEAEEEGDEETIQELLEPYSKEQLIAFVVEAATKDADLLNRIRDAADRDVSHRKIFVHGLSWDTTNETLVSAFQSFGEIDECNVVTDRATGKSKGYGFVLFKTRLGASKALKQPRKQINSRVAWCQLASLGPVAQPQPNQDTAGRKIYVTNVQANVDPEKLRAFFAKFGEIEIGPLGFDAQTGKSRGFALFVYKTLEGTRKALEEPYKMFEGHQLHCQKAADGKNKVGAAASITTAVQQVQAPVLAAVAAAQNFALYGQHPGLNPLYSGLLVNPNAGLMAAPGSANPIAGAGGLNQGVFGSAQIGGVSSGSGATGLGGFGVPGSHGLGSLGGSPSVLGSYGASGPTLQDLQQAYPSSQVGHPSSARAHGIGGIFSGNQSYM